MSEIKLKGGCHCGAVQFVTTVAKKVKAINCNCSICTMTGYLHLNVPHVKFELVKGETALSEYRFGTGKARHLFCKRCGIKSFYQPRSHPETYSINLNCCENADELEIEVIDFDGQNWEASMDGLQESGA